jgi:hypothetical protein
MSSNTFTMPLPSTIWLRHLAIEGFPRTSWDRHSREQ